MRKTKYVLPSFAFYDRTGIQNYLEKQAAKGWLLEKVSNLRWRFRRCAPEKIRFSVVYFPGADIFDPAPTVAEETFQEFCTHGGWTLAGANAQMQIFYTRDPDPVPIETDPVMEVENIHKSMKKGFLKSYWLLLVSCVLQLGVQILNYTNGVVSYLSNGMYLYLGATWILLTLLGTVRLISYYGWRGKARKAAEQDGVFVKTRSIMWLEMPSAILILGGMVMLILTLEDRRMAVVMGFGFAAAFLILILVEALRRWLKSMNFHAEDSKKYTTIVSVVLTLALCFIGIPIVASNTLNSERFEAPEADLVLDIRDLLGEEAAEHQTMRLTDQSSPFLAYQRIHQYPGGSRTEPSLEYNLVEVKADFLYDVSLEEVMAVPAYMDGGSFRSVDPAPWGVDKAWRLFDGEEDRNWYVLCRGDYIMEIFPGWELTAEQMAAVGDKLK